MTERTEKPTDGFKHKTYRCEWVAKIVVVDQYGREDRSTPPPYEQAWPTREEAEADMRRVTREHEHVKGRWVRGPYEEGQVSYREVEAPIEVTTKMISAALTSQAQDDEGLFPLLMDILDFSGENKAHTVMREALTAAMQAHRSEKADNIAFGRQHFEPKRESDKTPWDSQTYEVSPQTT